MNKMKKRKDGRYAKQILLGYSEDGKRKYKTLYGKTQAEVDKKERGLRSAIDGGYNPSGSSITLGEWLKEWLDTYNMNIRPNTLKSYTSQIKRIATPSVRDIKLCDLKPINLQSVLNDIYNEHPPFARNCCMLLKKALTQAYKEGYTQRNISVSLEIKWRKNTRRAFTDEEISIIESSDFNEEEQMFIDILRYTGLRRAELLALEISDIDFEKRVFHITKALALDCSERKYVPTKTKAGVRDIPILDVFYSRLKDYCAKREYLFSSVKGKKELSGVTYESFWKQILKKIKAQQKKADVNFPVTPHYFRHTYATDLYYAGVDPKSAQYYLGHASLRTTLEIYTHLDKEKLVCVVGKVNEYFSNKHNKEFSQNLVKPKIVEGSISEKIA